MSDFVTTLEKNGRSYHSCRYQGAAADLVVCFFEALAARTGWAWTVLGGGPHSDKINGANGVVSYHIGASPDGLKFSGAVESFDELIAVPFGKYCHRVFREYEDRLKVNMATYISSSRRGSIASRNQDWGRYGWPGSSKTCRKRHRNNGPRG